MLNVLSSLETKAEKFSNIFEKVLEMGIPYSHYNSDLYIPVTPETKKLIDNYKFKNNVEQFVSQTDGKPTYDIPFAYDRDTEKRLKRK